MDSLRSTYAQHAFALWLAVVLTCLCLVVWVALVQRRARAVEARLDAILSDVSEGNTPRMLAEYLTTVRTTAAAMTRMKEQHDQLAALIPSAIRHVGLVRFSPFHDTGGDQSFTLALLDGKADGVVVTALHSRHDSRLYAKPIEGGESEYSLTPEERQAMERAVGETTGTPRTSSVRR